MKRALISLIAGAVLLVAPISAIAADDATAPLPPLPPGGAAGIEQAQFANFDIPLLWWLGIGVFLGIGIYLSVRDGDSAAPVSTTGTN